MIHYPIDFSVPDYAAARLYDESVRQHKEATPESLRRALEVLFIDEPHVLARYLTPLKNNAATS
jgi:hypothetical protein